MTTTIPLFDPRGQVIFPLFLQISHLFLIVNIYCYFVRVDFQKICETPRSIRMRGSCGKGTPYNKGALEEMSIQSQRERYVEDVLAAFYCSGTTEMVETAYEWAEEVLAGHMTLSEFKRKCTALWRGENTED